MPTLQRYWNELRQWSLIQGSSILPPIEGTRLLLPSADYPGNIFYVATNGADVPIASGGGTAAAPFLTLTYAAAQMATELDFGGQAVTLQAVAGHAAFTGGGLRILPWVGGGSLKYDGAGGSIAAVDNNAIDAIAGALPGVPLIQNVALSTSGSRGTNANPLGTGILVGPSRINVGSGVSFGACVDKHAQAFNSGEVSFLANYSISGGAVNHWAATTSGVIIAEQLTITLTGTLNFGNGFCYTNTAGLAIVDGDTFSGSATGQRFQAVLNGMIIAGGGANYLPGNTAGSTSTGGQYI